MVRTAAALQEPIYNDRDLVFIAAVVTGYSMKRAGELLNLSERGTYKYLKAHKATVERGRELLSKMVSDFRQTATPEVSKDQLLVELEKLLGSAVVGFESALKRGDVNAIRELFDRVLGKVASKIDLKGQIEHTHVVPQEIIDALAADERRDKKLNAVRPMLPAASEIIDVEPG